MPLTIEQSAALKAAILAETNPEFVGYRTNGQTPLMSAWLNSQASPTYYVKRTSLSRHDILTGTSDDGTTFSWAGGAYITRNQGERDAFREMFNDAGTVDPWLPTILAAFADIFSGTGGAGNRAHIVAMSRRPATRFEKLYASGAGSKAAPSTLIVKEPVTDQDIGAALNLP